MKSIRKLWGSCWHLFCACIPGCGQMCQGYMKRGISQTIIFSALTFIAVFLEMGALALLVAPLLAYSFFDSLNLRRQIREDIAPEDEFMFGLSEMDSRKLNRILSRRGSLIGWMLWDCTTSIRFSPGISWEACATSSPGLTGSIVC